MDGNSLLGERTSINRPDRHRRLLVFVSTKLLGVDRRAVHWYLAVDGDKYPREAVGLDSVDISLSSGPLAFSQLTK